MTRRINLVAATALALAAVITCWLLVAASGSRAASYGSAGTCHPSANANCSKADLAGAKLSHLNLSHANLSNADLSGADLSYANLAHADLKNTDLINADLAKADLKDAKLTGAIFLGADLFGVVNSALRGATAQARGFVICHTILPSGRLPKVDC